MDRSSAHLSVRDTAAIDCVGRLLDGNAPLGVAFSGGVDSSVLLALAARHLGPLQILAIVGVSASLPEAELTNALSIANFLGVPAVKVHTQEDRRPKYVANGPDRCFHCKDELFQRVADDVAEPYGLAAIAYGENADDILRPDRPGAAAATKHRILRPLATAGIDKAAVRRIAHFLGLPNADKPAAPCLASRIPHFEPVTREKLGQIESAEDALRALGFSESRVRHHGDVARIELPRDDIERAALEPMRSVIADAIHGAGFRFVALDLLGLQSGAFTLPLVSGT